MDYYGDTMNYYVLLFWYIGERNWTVQSTSSIVKPRKDAEEYKPGDNVIAKFQGKPYKAVIIRIEAKKENLADDRLLFDKLLHDASLTPSQLLEKMGIASNLDTNDDSDKLVTKRPASKDQKKTSAATEKKKKIEKSESDCLRKDIKEKDKQHKLASLESSKLMAARILQNTKDNNMNPSNSHSKTSETTSTIITPTTVSHINSSSKQLTQLPATSYTNLQSLSTGVSASTTIQNISYNDQQSAPSLSLHNAHKLTAESQNLTSKFDPQYTVSHTQNTFNTSEIPYQEQPHYFQPNHVSSVQLPCQTSTQNMYENNSSSYYQWGYNDSASEYIAHNLTSDNIKHTTDCSKCMTHINALTQRITTLEQNIQTLLAANKPLTISTTSLTNAVTPQALQSAATNQHTPPIINKSSDSVLLAAENQSNVGADLDNITNDENVKYIDLIPGYGVKITVPQLDTCVQKAKGSGTALARLLINVFFDEETLAASSVRGTKTKPALDAKIVNAIIRYTWEKSKCQEKDVVQAINQKCSDSRTGLKTAVKKH